MESTGMAFQDLDPLSWLSVSSFDCFSAFHYAATGVEIK